MTAIWSRLPWERARAFRLLNVLTRRQLDGLAAIEAAAQHGMVILPPPYGGYKGPTEVPYAWHNGIHVPPIEGALQWEQDSRIHCYTAMVAFRRGVRLSLLLQAWKLRHGGLPKNLDELVGPDLDQVPIDPFTGAPFRYVREGVAIPFRSYAHNLSFHYCSEISAGVPFVWSAGPKVVFKGLEQGQRDPSFNNYNIIDDLWSMHPHYRSAESDYDVWEAGWPIPVP
jgi:hypothetical protein